MGGPIFKFVKSSDVATSSTKKGVTSSKGVWFCGRYQKNKCTKDSPHSVNIKGVNREVSHIGASCWLQNKVEARHPECSSSFPLFESRPGK